jgi:phosphoglycolate phosphatase
MAGSRFRAILFDLDGTLVDTLADLTSAVNFVLGRSGRPVRSQEEIRGFIGDGARRLLKESLGRPSGEAVEEAYSMFAPYYLAHCADRSALYPGVQDVLDRLRPAARLGVVTNKPEAPARLILTRLGVLDRFDVVIAGDTLPVKKPDPGPVREALQRLGVAAWDALMVGDSPGDVRAARAAGASSCGVLYGYRPEKELRDEKPSCVINEFREILAVTGV